MMTTTVENTVIILAEHRLTAFPRRFLLSGQSETGSPVGESLSEPPETVLTTGKSLSEFSETASATGKLLSDRTDTILSYLFIRIAKTDKSVSLIDEDGIGKFVASYHLRIFAFLHIA
jgi:hypothetical protein